MPTRQTGVRFGHGLRCVASYATHRYANPCFQPNIGGHRRGLCEGCNYREAVRIVSLLPSATEIVYALGLGDDLVGVTFECDEPPSARQDNTVVVGGRDTSGMAPAEIDAYVRERMAGGGDLNYLFALAQCW